MPGKPGIRGLLCATAVIAATIAAAREGAAEVVAEQQTAAVLQIAIMGVAVGVLVFLPAFCAVFMCKRAMLGFVLIVLFASALAAALAVAITFVATSGGRQPFVIQLAMCAALFLGPTVPLAGSLLVMRWAGWTLCRQPRGDAGRKLLRRGS
jgi:cytochrome bd-type quinol oxidase subunit 1